MRRVVVARRPRRTAETRSLGVDIGVFHGAAVQLEFSLDERQRFAAEALADPDRNLYLWGPAGRGKSWLMATYFAAVPTRRKARMHFHEFFRDLHRAIRRHSNNLDAALDDVLHGLDLVCFDEFHVHDPADGKFIARLLPALLGRKIRVVLTSNYAPQSLLPNPLFHEDFLPTIEFIEANLAIVPVDGPVDYRTISDHEAGFAAGWWVNPGTPEQLDRLGISPPMPDEYRMLQPVGHPVHLRRASNECLWIDFADLCGRTTAPVDYLALAKVFRRWVIDGVPDLRSAGREPAQRFANVVDVLYDRDVTTIFLSSIALEDFARGDLVPLDIARIESRLGQLQQC